VPVHLFVKPDLYANPDVADFGQVSADELRKNPAGRDLLTQTFLVKKREGNFAIARVRSTVEGLDVRIDPKNGKSSTFRVDVAPNPESIRAESLRDLLFSKLRIRDFHKSKVPVSGAIFQFAPLQIASGTFTRPAPPDCPSARDDERKRRISSSLGMPLLAGMPDGKIPLSMIPFTPVGVLLNNAPALGILGYAFLAVWNKTSLPWFTLWRWRRTV